MLLKQTDAKPFWVRTDDQYAGKGQGTHSWISDPGKNLTGTLVVFPDRFEAFRQFHLSEIFSVATAGFLEQYVDNVSIKWPNDLYAGDEKIGGILIETAVLGKFIGHAILGVGMNVNQVVFPCSLPNPVSLSLLTGLVYNLDELENVFLNYLVKQFERFESGDFMGINKQYLDKLYRFGYPSGFSSGGETFIAEITGVTEFGHLILRTETGTIKTFAYQEVEYIL